MSHIVDFYLGTKPDYLGRFLEEIWKWDSDHLEEVHDYIQILFPNRELSQFNAHALVLNDATVAAFLADERLRQNLAVSHDVMLRFYGLEYDPESRRVARRRDFAARARTWLSPYNHNYLRITRILKCLVALGLPERARAFFDALKEIYDRDPAEIGPETFAYWQAALAPLQPPKR